VDKYQNQNAIYGELRILNLRRILSNHHVFGESAIRLRFETLVPELVESCRPRSAAAVAMSAGRSARDA